MILYMILHFLDMILFLFYWYLVSIPSCKSDDFPGQGLSQDLETGCQNLAIVKFWGILFFNGVHYILRLQL